MLPNYVFLGDRLSRLSTDFPELYNLVWGEIAVQFGYSYIPFDYSLCVCILQYRIESRLRETRLCYQLVSRYLCGENRDS